MSDEEMVAWLRRQHATTHGVGFVAILGEIAFRLEALTKPAAGSPLRPAREAEIREDLEKVRDEHDWSVENAPGKHHRRRGFFGSCDLCILYELLDALDWERRRADLCEAILAEHEADHEKLVAVGVAKALAVVRDRDRLGTTYGTKHPLTVGESNLLRQVADKIEKECGPADLPPHLASLARLRELEEALEKIHRETRVRDLNDANKVMHCERIAREALAREEAT